MSAGLIARRRAKSVVIPGSLRRGISLTWRHLKQEGSLTLDDGFGMTAARRVRDNGVEAFSANDGV